MTIQTFSITDLYLKLEKSTNKETAEVVSKTIELLEQRHAQEKIEIKEELLKEIRLEELATKQDLKAEIEKAKSSIIIWLCSFIIAWTGILSAIFFHFSK